MVKSKIRRSTGEVAFDVVNTILLLLIVVVTVYPLLFVLAASFSDPARFASHTGLLLLPLGFDTQSYKAVLENPNIFMG